MNNKKPKSNEDMKSIAGIRMKTEQYNAIRQASNKVQRTMTSFVRLAAVAEADKVNSMKE